MKIDPKQPAWLVYDIPELSGIENPSHWLWHVAVRVNKSCWVCLWGNIPHARLQSMREAGASIYTIPFAAEASEQVLAMAVESLRKEAADAVARYRASCDAAQRRLDSEEEQTPEEVARYRTACRLALNRVRRTLNAMRKAQAAFGFSDGDVRLTDCVSSVQTYDRACQARGKALLAAADEIRSLYGNDDVIAELLERDEIIPGIAADYLDDVGGNGAAIRDEID